MCNCTIPIYHTYVSTWRLKRLELQAYIYIRKKIRQNPNDQIRRVVEMGPTKNVPIREKEKRKERKETKEVNQT